MCQSNIAPLLAQDPSVDEVLSFNRPSRWMHRREHLKIIEPIRQGEYDLGILLTNSFSSAYWFWKGCVERRVGLKANFRSFFLTDTIDFSENIEKMHLVDLYKKLLTPLQCCRPGPLKRYRSVSRGVQRARDLQPAAGAVHLQHQRVVKRYRVPAGPIVADSQRSSSQITTNRNLAPARIDPLQFRCREIEVGR